ncbi:MAG: winged helix-turn-helix domain-containing protein [Archaeoglobaceae archaeon]
MRSNVEIIIEILEGVRRGLSKNKIKNKGYFDHRVFQKYFNHMVENKIIEVREDGYRLTSKGETVLEDGKNILSVTQGIKT